MKMVAMLALTALLMTSMTVNADDESTALDVGGAVYVTDWGGPFPGVRAETNGCEGMQAHDECGEADQIIL